MSLTPGGEKSDQRPRWYRDLVETVAPDEVVTVAPADAEGTVRLTVVNGRLTRPLGAVGRRKVDPLLGRVYVRGEIEGMPDEPVTVVPRKEEGLL
jgi:hypothetical protein